MWRGRGDVWRRFCGRDEAELGNSAAAQPPPPEEGQPSSVFAYFWIGRIFEACICSLSEENCYSEFFTRFFLFSLSVES